MTRFIDNGDNTVTDTQTNLVWSKNTIAVDVDHGDAENAVKALGDGWRLPTVTELFGLVDHEKHLPAINTDFFPDTKSDWYWTSTPTAWNDAAVWLVHFSSGSIGYSRRKLLACVRAVRSSQ